MDLPRLNQLIPQQNDEVASVRSLSDVHVLSVRDKVIVLVGTIHVSQESADLVRNVIEEEKPDGVCVELDARRFEALSQQNKWESLDLKEIIRKKQLSTLIANLLLASYQKRLGDQLGVLPGTEMLEAITVSKKFNIPIFLCDRDVRVTMRRAWRSTPFIKKSMLVSSLMLSVFDTEPITEESLRNLKKQDVLSEMMQELGTEVPTLKEVLIDERDQYLAEKILQADGEKVVAVVGAGHVEGMKSVLQQTQRLDITLLDVIPPVSPAWKWVGWSIPAIIIGSIALIGHQKGAAAAGENALFWILAILDLALVGFFVANLAKDLSLTEDRAEWWRAQSWGMLGGGLLLVAGLAMLIIHWPRNSRN